MIAQRLISLVIGYICGLYLAGFFYSKAKHVDITKMGSGNVGTTNTLRNLGVKAGIITLLGDACKVIVALVIVWFLFHKEYPDAVRLFQLYAGLGAILGHNFPVYMKFKGGKGIACTGGLMLGYSIIQVPLCLCLFIGIVAFTKYVSLASIVVVITFFLQTIIFGQLGLLNVAEPYLKEVYILVFFIMVLGIVRHKDNIKRLCNGTENKISFHKKK